MATSTPSRTDQQAADLIPDRQESEFEQLDRNTVELMGELRVAGTGIQVLLAFLLIVPFNARFSRVSAFDRYDYFVTLVCIAAAAVLLIAPTIHHRLLFRRAQKDYLVKVGNQTTIVAIALLAVGLTGILVLISNFIFGGVVPIVVGALAAGLVSGLWFGIPLNRRRALQG